MQHDSKKHLFDIQRAASIVLEFTAGKTLADYDSNLMLRLAIERAFSIIGEALIQLARADNSTASRISDYRSIVGFRNILIHAYERIDNEIVWDIIQTKLPLLHAEVSALLPEEKM
jgi:uncharacterized protein with HEPN domain